MAATMDERGQQARTERRPWYASPLVGLAVLGFGVLAVVAAVAHAFATAGPSTGECNDRGAEIAAEYREARRLLAEGDLEGMGAVWANGNALAAEAQADGCELGL